MASHAFSRSGMSLQPAAPACRSPAAFTPSGLPPLRRSVSSIARRHGLAARSQSGRAEPFNENAAQVKRLINRDRKEFLGNASGDLLDKYQVEFGTDAASSSSSSSTTSTPAAAAPAAPAQEQAGSAAAARTAVAVKPVAAANPFSSTGAAAGSNPFGAPSSGALGQPFRSKSSIEPAGLRPDMSPDPFTKEKGFNLLENITLTQILLVFSFSLIIALMVGTFYFVFSVGGVRLNGI